MTVDSKVSIDKKIYLQKYFILLVLYSFPVSAVFKKIGTLPYPDIIFIIIPIYLILNNHLKLKINVLHLILLASIALWHYYVYDFIWLNNLFRFLSIIYYPVWLIQITRIFSISYKSIKVVLLCVLCTYIAIYFSNDYLISDKLIIQICSVVILLLISISDSKIYVLELFFIVIVFILAYLFDVRALMLAVVIGICLPLLKYKFARIVLFIIVNYPILYLINYIANYSQIIDYSNATRAYSFYSAYQISDKWASIIMGPGMTAWIEMMRDSAGYIPGLSSDYAEYASPHNIFVDVYLSFGLIGVLYMIKSFLSLYIARELYIPLLICLTALIFTTITGIDRILLILVLYIFSLKKNNHSDKDLKRI